MKDRTFNFASSSDAVKMVAAIAEVMVEKDAYYAKVQYDRTEMKLTVELKR